MKRARPQRAEEAPPAWPEWKVAFGALWPALIVTFYLALVALPVLLPLVLR